MKKFCFLIAMLLISSMSAYAYVESTAMTSEQFIKDEGYSPEVYKLINVKTRPEEARAEMEAKKNKNKVLTFLKKCYCYIDPYQDKENFGTNEIHYNNSWDEI